MAFNLEIPQCVFVLKTAAVKEEVFGWITPTLLYHSGGNDRNRFHAAGGTDIKPALRDIPDVISVSSGSSSCDEFPSVHH